MGDDGVEAGGPEVEPVRIADGELDAIADAVVGRERLGGRDEVVAQIDPRHGAGESVARRDGAGDDAGAAAQIQDRCRAR